MENSEEYHDPDYPGTSGGQPDQKLTEAERLLKIKAVVRREFANELNIREDEVKTIDQRLSSSRRLLHRLRCALVARHYGQRELQLPAAQRDCAAEGVDPDSEMAAIVRDGQRRPHPSVRRLLGRTRTTRRDYSMMVKSKNYTIPADNTKSLRPDLDPPQVEEPTLPKKVPRHIEPKVENVLTLDSATRNKQKHRYRIIIGNTSKYAPPASPADRSTHKWLLYVRGRAGAGAGAGAGVAGADGAAAGAEGAAAGAEGADGLAKIVTAVRVQLHHSYAPHHNVFLDKPPYRVARRGWGEFAARVELHFARPAVNRPASVRHTIRLDRNYTGLQTLGAETVVDVWLYSDEEMLPYEYKEDSVEDEAQKSVQAESQTDTKTQTVIKQELENTTHAEQVENLDNWLDFFNKDTSDLDVDEMLIKNIIKKEKVIDKEPELDSIIAESMALADGEIKSEPLEDIPSELLKQPTSPRKRIMKYMDPTTGKIYYLELDRTLDLTKVQEIVINSKGNRKTAKISPIKPNGLKSFRRPAKKGLSLLKAENETDVASLKHIRNDHCYLGVASDRTEIQESVVKCVSENVTSLYETLCGYVARLSCVRSAISFLLRKIPLTSSRLDEEYQKWFPFVVRGDEDDFWRLELAKRRNIEWSRAKLINRILTEHLPVKPIWRTKQILLFSKLHGYQPLRRELADRILTDESSWRESGKPGHPDGSTTLSVFEPEHYRTDTIESVDLSCEPDIDVVNDSPVKVKQEVASESAELQVLPVTEDERLRFLFVERKCAEIGIELKNEDVGSGYAYSAVHAVLLKAMTCFAEELVRAGLAAEGAAGGGVWTTSPRPEVSPRALVRAAASACRLRVLTSHGLAAAPSRTHPQDSKEGP